MNTLKMQRNRVGGIACLCAVIGCLLLSGCGAKEVDSTEQVLAGSNLLQAMAGERFEAGWSGRHSGYYGGGVRWADEVIARVDEGRFPDWAADTYELCIYWERNLSYDAMNHNRQPGEPNRYTFDGKAWGWILIKGEDVHVLELGIEFDNNPYLFVDAWNLGT